MKPVCRTSANLAMIGAVLCISIFAQTPTKLAFEVASIKPAPPIQSVIEEIRSGKRGIGSLQASIDDARADFGYMPLLNMLVYAYKMKLHQIVAPDWLGSQAFEIHAKIPEGATKDQAPEMMQSLLKERFKLVAHHENREQSVYALIVSKDGLKLKEAVAEVETPAASGDPAKAPAEKKSADKGELLSFKTPDGQMSVKQEERGMVVKGGPTGQMRVTMGEKGEISLEIAKLKMSDFSDLLTQFLERPVVDMTNLKGSYQVALEIPIEDLMGMVQRLAPKMGISLPQGLSNAGALIGAAPGAGGLAASDPSGGKIFQAVQKLGLKLDSRKAPVDTLVVDSIEKNPTED
jgi:uncharacterized protein (TIGR03435 family)